MKLKTKKSLRINKYSISNNQNDDRQDYDIANDQLENSSSSKKIEAIEKVCMPAESQIGIKQFGCTYCDKKFTRLSGLKIHERIQQVRNFLPALIVTKNLQNQLT